MNFNIEISESYHNIYYRSRILKYIFKLFYTLESYIIYIDMILKREKKYRSEEK